MPMLSIPIGAGVGSRGFANTWVTSKEAISGWSDGSLALSCANGSPTVTVAVSVEPTWLPSASNAFSSTSAVAPGGGDQLGALLRYPTYTLTPVAYSSKKPTAVAAPVSSPQPLHWISAAFG